MTSSSFDDFLGAYQIGGGYQLIPVYRQYLADTLTPVSAFLALVGYEKEGFLLESVDKGERWSRFSFVGRNTLAEVSLVSGRLKVSGDVELPLPTDPVGFLSTLESLLANIKAADLGDLSPLHAGFVGYMGYDVIREIEELPPAPPDEYGFPDAMMRLIGDIAVFDHWKQKIILISNVLAGPDLSAEELSRKYHEGLARVNDMWLELSASSSGSLKLSIDASTDPAGADSSLSSQDYCHAVRVAKEYIAAGDIFQVVLSKRFSFALGAHPVDFYRVLRQLTPRLICIC